MRFNVVSSNDGLIQDCEFWTNLGAGTISSDSVLLKQFTALMNIRYAQVFGRLQLLTGNDGAEDRNYSSEQFSTFPIAAGEHSYEFLTDEDGNTITDFTGVHISTGGDFTPLKRAYLSDSDAQEIMSPNASNVGKPTRFLEKGSVVYFDAILGISGTGKLFYRLVPSYFTSGDTTKAPGFVEMGHRLLSLGASLDWLTVYKPENGTTITRIEAAMATIDDDLEAYTRQKNPTRARMTGAVHSSR